MKLKYAVILFAAGVIYTSCHYHDPITITLPSPEEIADKAAEIAKPVEELMKKTSVSSTKQTDYSIYAIPLPDQNFESERKKGQGECYVIRSSWENIGSQKGAYNHLEYAVMECPVGYFVYNQVGEIVYTPCSP